MLVSRNVICFAYFMPMCHGCNKKPSQIVFTTHPPPHPHPLPDFHQVCVSFYKKYFINLFLLWWDCCTIWFIFKVKHLFFQLIAVFYMYFLRVLFHSSVNMKLRIASYLYICVASYLAPHQIIWHNKSIPGHCLKITSNYSFFGFKFKVDTISIISSYLYYFRKINKELFRYC